jgi:hypothetical protein
MQEMIAPLLLSLPRDGTAHPFAIFRPTAGHWDSGTALVRELAGSVLAILRLEGGAEPEILILTADGDYLYGENTGPVKARRVPTHPARQRMVRETLRRLNGG